jgi:hypothetical protein
VTSEWPVSPEAAQQRPEPDADLASLDPRRLGLVRWAGENTTLTRGGIRLSRSPEWEELRLELEAVAAASSCFNAYVLDAWDNFWCAARGFTEAPREDLADLVHAAATRKGVTLTRGGKLDTSLSGRTGHAYLRSYGSCYVLLLRFSGPFDVNKTREAVLDALPRLEALTIRLPPPDGPGADGSEAAGTA